ncbi:TonB-dependent receptor [Leptospira weilii str. 2006001853]|uniref:TonB-dependent receptor n=3 Tax=Leptospira weilii TaxID=28184 RepID=A0A828YWC0_9LEPT|nr:TonB-dependent receptor [Leptospira weilii]EMM71525.1 TonB-dependent receptor [Leptospira weilii str. 2006001855]EKR62176.1 TonB-dependent receptor [Leptospira weilii str. 2006001853]EMN44537.1 TonB-dependent receptor [Leptospira weilii str. LNT 1234]EMN89218.1 TonB-dependent receptor [Leptospira weilii str. UI 13098]MCL8265739.1 TonB-dependent receptor [Leptospira weilii]
MFFSIRRFFQFKSIQILFPILFCISVQAQDESTKVRNKVVEEESPNKITTKNDSVAAESLRKENGQNIPEESQIVVTGSRGERRLKDSTVATEVISRKKIEASGARNAAEVLETQLGIDVVPFFGGSRVRMLGLDSQYVLILIDGERIAGRLNNAVDLSRFKVQNLERIEIVKGASSALYGADAIGGVINLITREADKKLSYEMRTTYGNGSRKNFNTEGEFNTNANMGFRNEFVSGAVSAGYNKNPGYRLVPNSQATTGNAYQDLNTGMNLTFNPDGNFKGKTRILYQHRDQSGVDVTQSKAIFDRNNKTHDFLATGSLEYGFGKRNLISFRGNISKWENKYYNNQRGADELDVKQLNAELTSQGTVQLDMEASEKHFITIGAESFANELESDRLQSRYVYRTRKAVFFQDEWTVSTSPRIRVIPGVRYDDDSQFGNQTTPKLAARYDIFQNLVWRTSYGRGFRPPSFQELYLRFENPAVGYVVEGNPNLKPERSITINSDLEYSPFRFLTFSLSLYRNDIINLIQYKFDSNKGKEFAEFQLQNIAKAYTRGGEFGVQYKFLKYFTLELGYNHTDTRDLNTDRPLEGRALHQASANFIYNSPGGFQFNLRGKHLDKRPFYSATNNLGGQDYIPTEVKLNENPPVIYGKPFTILNVRIEQKFFNKHFSLFLGVDNVLNQYELAYNPTRPRFYYGGFSAQF